MECAKAAQAGLHATIGLCFERVTDFITRYSMFAPGARIGVAVSGGADSVCLLHLLFDLAAEWDLRLTVLHLNHKLRGEESETDEQFVREMAASLKLPVIIEAWQWGGPWRPPESIPAAGPQPSTGALPFAEPRPEEEGEGPPGSRTSAIPSNLEEAAREARLAFFARVIRERRRGTRGAGAYPL